MLSRLILIVTAVIGILAFDATDALARGGHSGAHIGGFSGHFGGFHHRHFFVGGGYVPYDEDHYDYDYEDRALVRIRVATRHGLRWRWVRSCAY